MNRAGLDQARLARVLGDPDLSWLVDRVAARLARDLPLDTEVVLTAPTAGQRRAVARLLGRRPPSGATLSVSLPALADLLRRAGIAPDLQAAVEALRGPVASAALARDQEERARRAALAAAADCRHADAEWFHAWLADLTADGTLTKLVRSGHDGLLGDAAGVLDRLPAADLPLPVLAHRACGDTKALSGTRLGALLLRAVRLWQPAVAHGSERELWARVGVVLDDLASQVLVLNLPADGDGLGAWLTDAARRGLPFRVTLHQLTAALPTVSVAELFVCENPAVLRVAAAELGAGCAPLVCTEGVPSQACHRLVAAAAAGGAAVRWRGDFDWVGVRNTADAIGRHGAAPWRMGIADYLAGLDHSGVVLAGAPADTPWEPLLASTMADRGRAVMEEHLIPTLLADLRG